MNLALGCLFLFTGSVCLYMAARPFKATTPWGAYQEVINRLKGVSTDGEQAA